MSRAAPRRLLMTGDSVGGVWSYSLELARELGREGVEVVLATMGAPLTADQRAEAARVPGLRIEESRFRLEWMEDPWADVRAADAWLLALDRDLRPDLVHLNGYAHVALPWSAPTLVVAHSCVCSWFEAVRGCEAPAEWTRYRTEVARGLACASAVTAPTAAMLSALERHHGPFAAAGHVPNGRRAEAFPPGAKAPFVFSAGRLWDDAKNVRALGRIAPSLPWPVYVAGDAERPEGGRTSFAGLKLVGRLGTEEMASWLGRASIYALPARYEPFGLSALEAALAGCALVLGDIASLREVWGDAALYAPPDDTDALAAALGALIADGALRRELAGRARDRALTFTPERMASGYLSVYERLLGAEAAA